MSEEKREYSLLCNQPLSGFDESVLRLLETVGAPGFRPRAAVFVVLTEGGEVVTGYHEATMQDMMVAKGFIDLDIQNDNILGNLPWFLEHAREEGLVEYYKEDVDPENWEVTEEEDTEDG